MMKKEKVRKTKTGGKFLRGALVGAALGVAAGVFAKSKAGKKFSREVKARSAGFYKSVAPQIKKAAKLGEAEYKKFIGTALAEYQKNAKSKKGKKRS